MFLIGQYDSPFVRRVAIALRLYGIAFEHRPWSTFGDAAKIAPYNPLLRVPTLVLWGDGDGIVSSDYGQKLCRSLPKARFELIRKAGHYPQIERPAEVADAIDRFARGEVL